MREPVPAVEPSLPPPAPSLLPRKGLREPDEKFIADLAQVIRAGARPMTGALWLGVSRPTWRKWRQRSGEPYDQDRTAPPPHTHQPVSLSVVILIVSEPDKGVL